MDLVDILLGAALLLSLCWLGGGLAAFTMARQRGGNQVHWAAYAIFLGPFGLILAHVLSHPCPKCGAKILRGLRLCPFCGHPIPQLSDDENPKGTFWSYRRGW